MKPTLAGQVTVETFESRVLRGNPWSDPVIRKLPLYLPPSYGRDSARRYPVLWCLTGFTGSGMMLLNLTAFGENLPQRLDRLIAARKMRECIVAMPDCMTWLGGSQYIDSATNGRYEAYLCDELVELVDVKYRTMPRREHRGVFGKSSGGYGALTLGMRRPEIFGAVGCHSGDMGFDLCYRPDFAKAIVPLERHGGPKGFIKKFRSIPKHDAGDHAALNALAMAAAYSPSLGRKQPSFDLPFDLRTGELDERVWRRWLEWDPVVVAGRYVAALRSLRLLFIDCGVRDEFFLHLGARMLANRLDALGVRHVRQEFDGGHFDIAHRYDVSLPLLSRAVGE